MAHRGLAIVAGVGPGLGRALARRLARDGFTVGIIARRPEGLAPIAEEIAAEGGHALPAPADLTDFAALTAAIAALEADHGGTRALVYNASVWNETPALSFDPDAFQRDLALMVTAPLVATQAVAPGMEARGGGTVVWTGGGLALAPEEGTPVPSLAAGKAGMRALALAAAPELAARGIRLRTITIAGPIAPQTPFDPDVIASVFASTIADPAADGPTETVFRGAPA